MPVDWLKRGVCTYWPWSWLRSRYQKLPWFSSDSITEYFWSRYMMTSWDCMPAQTTRRVIGWYQQSYKMHRKLFWFFRKQDKDQLLDNPNSHLALSPFVLKSFRKSKSRRLVTGVQTRHVEWIHCPILLHLYLPCLVAAFPELSDRLLRSQCLT
jgi:hypothetical protein